MCTRLRDLRRAATGEDGISLVEVLVAMTLLAVTMAATASGVIRSLEVARESRESVIGANIAQYELERLRSIPFVDWVTSAQASGGTTTTTATEVGPNRQAYTVTREATWVQAGAATDGCTTAVGGGGSGADYVRVRQVVSFANPDIPMLENITIITPRLDFYDPLTGNIAVIVRDRTGVGVPGHEVRIQGPSGNRLALTDTNGCAFFAFLPVSTTAPTTNQWTVSLNRTGHVERRLKVQAVSEMIQITAQNTSVVSYEYDRAVSYDPRPVVGTLPTTGCTVRTVTLGARYTNASDTSAAAVDPETPTYQPPRLGVECVNASGAVVPTGWNAAIPYNLAYTVYNSSTTFSNLGRVTTYPLRTQSAVPDTQTRVGAEICGLFDAANNCTSRVLFPYLDGYTMHAGRCPMADPTTVGGTTRTRLDTLPGTDYTGIQVPLGLVTVTARDGSGNTMANQDVYADMRDTTNCAAGDRLYLGRTAANGTLRALVPYGRWVVFFDAPGDTTVQGGTTPFSCAVRPANCYTIRPDGAGTAASSTGAATPAVTDRAAGYTFNIRRGDLVTS